MEEIKIFATEISGIGITKYKDPVTEKEVEVEYKQPILIQERMLMFLVLMLRIY